MQLQKTKVEEEGWVVILLINPKIEKKDQKVITWHRIAQHYMIKANVNQ